MEYLDLKIGYVYYNNEFAGLVYEDNDGFAFKYDESYLHSGGKPISLTLPISEKEFHSNILFPFFDGLIPEGWLLKIEATGDASEQDDLLSLDEYKEELE